MNKNKNAYSPAEKFSSSAILWMMFSVGLGIGCCIGFAIVRLIGG